jgi:hypothetical protein
MTSEIQPVADSANAVIHRAAHGFSAFDIVIPLFFIIIGILLYSHFKNNVKGREGMIPNPADVIKNIKEKMNEEK